MLGLKSSQAPPPGMDIHPNVCIQASKAEPGKLGVWCKVPIKEGVRFGPFVGEKAIELKESMDPNYMWEIADVETKELLFYIDATNPHTGNWMRYLTCVTTDEQPNVLSEQDGIDIYFRTTRDIKLGEELLVSSGNLSNKRRRSKQRFSIEVKRASISPAKPIDNISSSQAAPSPEPKVENCEGTEVSTNSTTQRKSVRKVVQLEPDRTNSPALDDPEIQEKIERGTGRQTEEEEGKYFKFDLLDEHIVRDRASRVTYQCDVCDTFYKHSFSLKRHFIKAHVNMKYISAADATGIGIKKPAAETVKVRKVQEEVKINKEVRKGNEGDKKSGAVSSNRGSGDDVSSHSNGSHDNTESTENKNNNNGKSKNDNKSNENGDGDDAGSETLNLEVEEIVEGTDDSPRGGLCLEVDDAGSLDSSDVLAPVHKMPGLFQCNLCDLQCDTVTELKDHLADHTMTRKAGAGEGGEDGDKKYACQHCDMRFKHKQNLVTHEVVHSGAKEFRCSYCDKRFPTLTNQRRHERIHKGQKLSCSQCPATFTQAGDLKKHSRKLHPETYEECGYCNKYYTSESALAAHLMRAHATSTENNRNAISVRRDARKQALEQDQAESRRLATFDDPAQTASTARAQSSSSSRKLEYACTVCRKRFHDYTNMCRHRRLAHGHGVAKNSSGDSISRPVDVDCSSDDLEDGVGAQLGWKRMDSAQAYFAHVSRNIHDNLTNHLEGKAEQILNAGSLIRWKGSAVEDQMVSGNGNERKVRVEDYNFPRGFNINDICSVFQCTSDTKVKTSRSTGALSSKACRIVVKPSIEQFNSVPTEAVDLSLTSGNNDTVLDFSVTSKDNTNKTGLMVEEQPEPCSSTNESMKKECLLDGEVKPEVGPGAGRKYLCLVCGLDCVDELDMHDHQLAMHANIDCKYIEVDSGYSHSASLVKPCANGLLNVSTCHLPKDINDVSSGRMCSKCGKVFSTFKFLHQHIVDCGDYWRHLTTRVKWIYVLRGTQLSNVNKQTKQRGKFKWGDTPRKQQQQQQQQNLKPLQNGSSLLSPNGSPFDPTLSPMGNRRSARSISRTRSTDSLEEMETRRRRGSLEAAVITPASVKKRIMELVDSVEKCLGCGEKFDTILQLERHIPSCSEKRRLIEELNAAEEEEMGGNGEDDYDPTKHLCIYCERQFTYARTLRKHVTENCAARKKLVEEGEYIDLEWEEELSNSIGGAMSLIGSGTVSRDVITNFNDQSATDDAENSNDGKKNKSKRRRGYKWGNKPKPKRTNGTPGGELADGGMIATVGCGGDSLFGWEDAFLSTWKGKDEVKIQDSTKSPKTAKSKNQKVSNTSGEKSIDSKSVTVETISTNISKESKSVEKVTDSDSDKNKAASEDSSDSSSDSTADSVPVVSDTAVSNVPGSDTRIAEAAECTAAAVSSDGMEEQQAAVSSGGTVNSDNNLDTQSMPCTELIDKEDLSMNECNKQSITNPEQSVSGIEQPLQQKQERSADTSSKDDTVQKSPHLEVPLECTAEFTAEDTAELPQEQSLSVEKDVSMGGAGKMTPGEQSSSSNDQVKMDSDTGSTSPNSVKTGRSRKRGSAVESPTSKKRKSESPANSD